MQSGKAARAPTMEILPPAVRSEQGQAGNGDLVARECPQCGKTNGKRAVKCMYCGEVLEMREVM